MINKQTTNNRNSLTSILSILSLTILIFLLSFPKLNPVIQTGLDGSVGISINYFFAQNIQFGVDVLFTYGPLGFLKMPLALGNNLTYGIIFLSFIRLLFIFLLLYFGRLINKEKWLVHFLVALGISMLITFDLIIIGIIIISLLINYEKGKEGFLFYLAIFFTVLSILIKASTGIYALTIIISYLLLSFL